MTRDPFPGIAVLPSTRNPYAYALNNPVRYTDPSGEFVRFLTLGVLIRGGWRRRLRDGPSRRPAGGVIMENDRLVGKILDACERFERGDLSVAELQASLEMNAWALVGVDKKVRSKLRDFTNTLETIQFASPLEMRYQATCSLIKELRAYLRSAL